MKEGNQKGNRVRIVFSLLIIVSAAFIAYHPILSFGFLGHDTYPILVSGPVQSIGNVTGIFTEKLMEGRFESDFYRPLHILTFAIDHAIWGLNPFGYQLTNLLLLTACAVCLFFFVRRIAGPGSLLAPFVASLVFTLHPVQYEILPVSARRQEALCCIFIFLALTIQFSPRSLALRRPLLLPSFFTLLALGSKETAFLVPLFVLTGVAFFSPRVGWWARLAHGLFTSIPHVLAVAVAMLARLTVIGSIGGHGAAGMDKLVNAGTMLVTMVFPQQVMLQSGYAGWLIGALTVALVATIVLPFALRKGSEKKAQRSKLFLSGSLAAIWTIVMLLLHAYIGMQSAWFLFFPMVGFAILCGILLEAFLPPILRAEVSIAQLAGGLTSFLLVVLLCWQALYSPLFHHYHEWEKADSALHDYLEQIENSILSTPGGNVIYHTAFPYLQRMVYRDEEEHPRIQGAAILNFYTLQAWADLTFPGRRIRILQTWPKGRPVPPGVLVIITHPTLSTDKA